LALGLRVARNAHKVARLTEAKPMANFIVSEKLNVITPNHPALAIRMTEDFPVRAYVNVTVAN
jgi:hypothetical protein